MQKEFYVFIYLRWSWWFLQCMLIASWLHMEVLFGLILHLPDNANPFRFVLLELNKMLGDFTFCTKLHSNMLSPCWLLVLSHWHNMSSEWVAWGMWIVHSAEFFIYHIILILLCLPLIPWGLCWNVLGCYLPILSSLWGYKCVFWVSD